MLQPVIMGEAGVCVRAYYVDTENDSALEPLHTYYMHRTG